MASACFDYSQGLHFLAVVGKVNRFEVHHCGEVFATVSLTWITVSLALLDSPYAEVLGSNLASRSVDQLNDSDTKCNKPGGNAIVHT